MYNCSVNDYRKRRNWKKIVHLMEDNMVGVVDQPVNSMGGTVIMMKELRNILDNRIPFGLHFNGFGYHEIAEQPNVPLCTVKSRIFFERKKLKSMIEGHYGNHAQYARIGNRSFNSPSALL